MKITRVKVLMVAFSVELCTQPLKNVWMNLFLDYDTGIWNLFLLNILDNVINCYFKRTNILWLKFPSLILET